MNALPPYRRCVGCGKTFRAWQESAACPACRRATRPDREALTGEIQDRRGVKLGRRAALTSTEVTPPAVDEQLTLDGEPEPHAEVVRGLRYNDFPPGY